MSKQIQYFQNSLSILLTYINVYMNLIKTYRSINEENKNKDLYLFRVYHIKKCFIMYTD